MVDPLSTRDLIKRLGTFLADLTLDRPAARIHAEILDRLRESWQEPDPQLSGIYFDDKDFSSVWTAIRNGASLPINSWDTVVLPVIVYYSSRDSLKPNLETAIHLWRQARSSLSNVLEASPAQPIVPVYEVVDEQAPDTVALPASPAPPAGPARAPRARRSARRWLVAALASALIALAAVAVVRYDNAGKEPYAGTLPRNMATGHPAPLQPITSPSLEPSPTASPSPETSMPPATSMPPGVVAPSPPRALAAIGKTQSTATLSWQPPATAGTRGLSHYRIFKGMAEIASTMGTSFTVTGLAPKTTYVFSVLAVNRAGASSPPSNPVSVTTDAPPPPPPPPAPSPIVTTSPESPIPYGMAFTVSGDNWPCSSPAQLAVYLRNELIATPSTDDKGHFDASIEVIYDLPNAQVRIIDREDEYLILSYGAQETIKVVLTSHPQCSSTAVQYLHVVFN